MLYFALTIIVLMQQILHVLRIYYIIYTQYVRIAENNKNANRGVL